MARPKITGATLLNERDAARLAGIFKSLADPTRLRLVSALTSEELCVHELADRLHLEQSAVSHQLRLLRDRELVRTRRDGRHIYYSLSDGHVKGLFDFALEHAQHTQGKQ
jgi:ArsR family transcriptional regulator